MKPMILWLTAILALLALLIMRGGFVRPALPFVVGIMVVGLIAGFLLARKGRKS